MSPFIKKLQPQEFGFCTCSDSVNISFNCSAQVAILEICAGLRASGRGLRCQAITETELLGYYFQIEMGNGMFLAFFLSTTGEEDRRLSK